MAKDDVKNVKKVKPSSVHHADAEAVLKNFFQNQSMRVNHFESNLEGGVTIVFEDVKGQYPVKLNRAGFLDVIKFGLEAIAENHD